MDNFSRPSEQALLRKLTRETASRKQAEKLLEQKSLELFDSTKKLELALSLLEVSSAENMIKLEFKQQIDALIIRFGREFLNYNLDDDLLDKFVTEIQENPFINRCVLDIHDHSHLRLSKQYFGDLIDQEAHHSKSWQDNSLNCQLIIKDKSFGCLRVVLNDSKLEHDFVESTMTLVAELLCGAINRQLIMFKNIESRRLAEKSARSTRDFVAMVNHELRTPLNGLLGSSELLSETKLTSEQNLLVNNVAQSGELLRVIINDLLDFSKIESGMFELFPTEFNIESLITSLNSIFMVRSLEKSLKFEISLADAVPVTVKGDLERITQVFVNLIGNAIKFTEQGSVLVSLDWKNELFYFSVKDTGIGINEKSQTKLFQPFTQVDRSSKRNYEGTGLGLAICHQLIKLMGGEIRLQSEEGIGTTFFGSLPLTVIERNRQSEVGQASNQTLPKFDNLAVLVVDDIKMNQFIIRKMLTKFNIDSDVAANGIEALTATESHDYDLIFMDCRMPEMDGFEATAELRNRQFLKPIIALTASTTSVERNQCLECGMNDIITKPYTVTDIKSILLKYVNS